MPKAGANIYYTNENWLLKLKMGNTKSGHSPAEFVDTGDPSEHRRQLGADAFFIEVRNIIDTMCLDKIPQERFKRNLLRW